MATKSIKKNYIFSLTAKAVALLVPILITPYVSRILGADGVGVCSYIASIVSYFVLVANLGVESYALREIAMHRDDENYIKRLVAEITIFKTFMTACCLVAYYCVFIVALDLDDKLLYAVYSITLVAVAFDYTWFYQGTERFDLLALFNIVARVIYVPLVLVLVKDKSDIWLYSFLTVTTTALGPLLGVPFLFKYAKGKITQKIRPFRHFKPCMVYFLPAIAIQVYTVVDKTMIGLITNSDFENGYYEQADKLVKLSLTVILSISAIMESRVAYYYSSGKFDEIDRLTEKCANFMFMLAFPMTCGWIAVSRTLVPIYLGGGYDKCIELMCILAPIVSIIIISNMLGSLYYTPFGFRKKSALFLIVGAIVNVVLNSFMIYLWRSVGAAVASVIAEAVISTLYVVFARKFFSPKRLLKIAWRYIAAAVIMGGSVFAMNYFLPASIGYLALEVAAGVALYAMLLWVFRVRFFTDNVKNILFKIFRVKGKVKAAAVAGGDVAEQKAPQIEQNEEVGDILPDRTENVEND